jgi:hypothetical protein
MVDVTARHRGLKPLVPIHIDGFLGTVMIFHTNAITNCFEGNCLEYDDDKKPQAWPIHPSTSLPNDSSRSIPVLNPRTVLKWL